MSETSDRDLSELYRAGAREEPPAALDNAVLQSARRQATARSASVRSTFGTPWRSGLALAAVVVLAISLVATLRDHDERRWQSPGDSESQQRPATQPAAPDSSVDAETELKAQDRARRALPPARPAAPTESAESRRLIERDERPSASKAPAPPVAERSEAGAATSPEQEEQLSPEEWLHRIAALRQQGRVAEADQSLARFRVRYPDHPAAVR